MPSRISEVIAQMPPPRRKPASASRIFVDREDPKRTFEDAAFNIPAKGCALRTWYGVGGQGKTALARELFHLSSAEVDPSYGFLRRAMLDLHGRPKTDPDRLLVWIRNAFARSGIEFPAFDLAFAILWEKTRGEEPLPNFEKAWLQRTGEGLAESAPDAVMITRELIEEFAETIPGLGFLLRRGAQWGFEKGKKAWLERSRTYLQELYRDGVLIEDYEISALMPWMLAQDLNHHLKSNPNERFALFIDEYERVTEGAGTGARWSENPFDRHMRAFIAETDGMLAIFFSRERLHWEDDPDWKGLLEGNQHLLGGLGTMDAELWLSKVPIEDSAICSAVIEGARETKDPEAPVYPLLLDLQVEHWRNLGEDATPSRFDVEATEFESRRRELVQRLLRDYGDAMQNALERLALAHRFDRGAFEHIVKTFNIPLAFDAFDKLADLSILSLDEDGWLTPHRAIADAIVLTLNEEKAARSTDALLAYFVEKASPNLPKEVTDDTLACMEAATHLRLRQGVEGYVGWLADATETISAAARAVFLEQLWQSALDLARGALGESHSDTGVSYNNVAFILNAQGRYEEAEPLYRKGLDIRRAALGEAHPDTGSSYNNVAANLNDQGRYEEAEPLYRKGLDIRRAALGEAHPDTGTSYNNVAFILNAQGRYKEAEPLNRKGLDIRRAALGEAHPHTGTSYNNVAFNLNAQGRYEEAEPLYRKGLDIRRAALGEAHPDTGASYNNVAGNLNAQGRYEEAEPLYHKGLDIRRAALGEAHPDTGTSYNNVAFNLNAQGRYEEAEPLYRKGLDIRRAALGEAHPSTGASYNNVAGNLNAQDRYEEAEPLYRKGLDICRAALGEAHPIVNKLLSNLGNCLLMQRKQPDAEKLLTQAYDNLYVSPGPEHPWTLGCRQRLDQSRQSRSGDKNC